MHIAAHDNIDIAKCQYRGRTPTGRSTVWHHSECLLMTSNYALAGENQAVCFSRLPSLNCFGISALVLELLERTDHLL